MCSKVSDLVSFFESLDSSRDKKKNTSNKNATSNSISEPRSGKVKNYGIELRGINQTPSEIKTTVNNVETNNNIRIKKEKMETEEFYKLDSKTNKNYINHPRKEAENYSSTKVERKIYNDSESQNVEKFESKKRGSQLQNKNSNFKENDKENEISNTSPKYVSRLSFKNINTKEYEDKVSDEIGSSMELEEEDIFGTNDFEENFADNYAVETYNRNGGELFGLQIIRRSLNLNRNRSDKINPIKDSNVNLKDKHKDSKKSFENNYSIDSDTVQKPEKQKENVSAQAHKTNFDVKIESSKIEEYEQMLVLDEFQPGKQYVKKFQQKKRSECPSQEKDKINDIIKELLQTEENYIYTLQEAVEIYKPYLRSIERHNRIKNSWRVFGNIEKIYEHSKIFLASLTINCDTVDKIAQVFIDSESVFFDLYPKYAEHKPKSDYYIKEFEDVIKTKQKHLLSKLGLKDLLIAPIQRMPRYKEMLTKIQKELTRNNNSTEIINKAIDIIHQVTEKCNNSVKHNNIPKRPKRSKNRLKRLNSRRLSNGSLPISSMLLNSQNAKY